MRKTHIQCEHRLVGRLHHNFLKRCLYAMRNAMLDAEQPGNILEHKTVFLKPNM